MKGGLGSFELNQLKLAGLKFLNLPSVIRGKYMPEHQRCEVRIDSLVARPRRNIGVHRGAIPCPNTSLNEFEIRECAGVYNYLHVLHAIPRWNPGGHWPALFRGDRLHPIRPQVWNTTPQSDNPFLCCGECEVDSQSHFTTPPRAARIAALRVAFCKTHSLQAFNIDRGDNSRCRCLGDIQRPWACYDHRERTAENIWHRADAYNNLLFHMHRRRPRHLRLESDYERERKRNAKTRHEGNKDKQVFADANGRWRKQPACPVPGCGKPGWKHTTARGRMSMCVACGGAELR